MIVPFDLYNLGTAFDDAGLMPRDWESVLMRNEQQFTAFDSCISATSLSRAIGETNVIDMLIGFWFNTLSEDQQIDVGMMLHGDTDLPDNIDELVDVSDLIDVPHDHLSGAVAMTIMFGTGRVKDIMQTVHANPERLALDKCQVIAEVVASMFKPLPF